MRILHCGKFHPPHCGGMETFVGQLAQAQAQAGDAVLVLAHAGPGQAGGRADAGGVRVRRARAPWSLGGYAPVAPAMPLAFLQARHGFRPEVIHVHTPNPAALWPALFCGRTPMVLHWHADVQFPPGREPSALLLACWRRLEALVLARADAVIATTQAYLDSSPALAGHRRKCRVVPLGLAEPARTAAHPTEAHPDEDRPPMDHPTLDFLDNCPDGCLRVLAVGRLTHYKGFAQLCEAVLDMPGAWLCLVGQGEEHDALMALAAQPEARGRIHLAGGVPDAVLDACYRGSHVLCLPSLSRSEAFGLVLLEAMSRGLPTIATSVPGSGMAEVLRHGATGLLVRPGSARELGQALRRLAADPELRGQLGRAGRERFARNYAMPEVARRIRCVYEDVLAARQP